VNGIEVRPHWGRSDSAIRDDLVDALTANPATESFEITPAVDDGVVSLQGEVESYRERQLAEKVAKGVRGVRTVDNQIDVDYAQIRQEAEIRADVTQALRWDTMVDDARIDVSVNGQEVVLSGTVGSAAERRQAELDAYVAGVESVDVSEVEVAHWAREDELRAGKYTSRADEGIARAVDRLLEADPEIAAEGVRAIVEDGAVTLRGEVPSLSAKREAARDARSVVGVSWVKNRLKVAPPQQPRPEQLESDVRDALERDPYLEPHEIAVAARHGEVTLSGTVDDAFERSHAEDVVAEVSGVQAVENNLGVDDVRPLVHNPYVDEPYLGEHDWYPGDVGYTSKGDARIREHVLDQLRWSPFVDVEDVSVAVEDGVVTLTGHVQSWSERAAATENAFEAGAVRVENELEVTS
jgi:osmotically-inducible protein OsmY